jgi:hypothetical protein
MLLADEMVFKLSHPFGGYHRATWRIDYVVIAPSF